MIMRIYNYIYIYYRYKDLYRDTKVVFDILK